jgi:hypothetical protein
MEAIIIAIAPIIVNAIISFAKNKQIVVSKFNPKRKTILRAAVATLSIVLVVGTNLVTGEQIDAALLETSVTTLLQTLYVLVGSQITYFGYKVVVKS